MRSEQSPGNTATKQGEILGLDGAVGRQRSREVVSATLENEAGPTLENEATGSLCSSLPRLGS